jgi:hypothetical protein
MGSGEERRRTDMRHHHLDFGNRQRQMSMGKSDREGATLCTRTEAAACTIARQ